MKISPPRLLIVDDEAAILFALGDYLSRSGYGVDRARGRAEAEGLLAAASYDLVVVDLRLGVSEPRGGMWGAAVRTVSIMPPTACWNDPAASAMSISASGA